LDEIFDLSLYVELQGLAKGDLRQMLIDLSAIEKKHVAFWQKLFDLPISQLDLGRRIKLRALVWCCRLFGNTAIHMVLEAIEIYGVRKYLSLWERHKAEPLGAAIREVLRDEFEHEDRVVSATSARWISPGKVRSMVLGFNDGLVEILGAVSGFFAAFQEASLILAASFSVAVAGAFSMAAGAYVAASSAQEMEDTERGRRDFLGGPSLSQISERPTGSAILVGASYIAGSLIPVLPVVLGVRSIWPSLAAGGAVVIFISLALAFLSGMSVVQRLRTNLLIMGAAVGVTYAIGLVARKAFGIDV
jgi:VIT1/CCC1 family predicted Fe2+/Mn2+ transporter